MATVRCPICQHPFDTEFAIAMPFCSERCRRIDLGRWLNEEYSVPVETDPDEQVEEAWIEEGHDVDGRGSG